MYQFLPCEILIFIFYFCLGGKVLSKVEGNIKFEDVSFVYPTRDKSPIFKNLSLDVKPGTSKYTEGLYMMKKWIDC